MDAPAAKTRASGPRNPRRTLQLTFATLAAKEAFNGKLERLQAAFAPEGSSPLQPVELLAKLFELADAHLAA